MQELARVDLPEPHRAIGAGAGQQAAIRAEGHRPNQPCMSMQRSQELPRAGIPQAHHVIIAAGRQQRSRRVESEREGLLGMCERAAHLRLVPRDFPQAHEPVAVTAGQCAAVRTEACCTRSITVAEQRVERPARVWIP
jgi:hypothetical protein